MNRLIFIVSGSVLVQCWSVLPAQKVGSPHSIQTSVCFLIIASCELCVLQFTHELLLLAEE